MSIVMRRLNLFMRRSRHQAEAKHGAPAPVRVRAAAQAPAAAAPDVKLAAVNNKESKKPKPQTLDTQMIEELLKQPLVAMAGFAQLCQNAVEFMQGFEDKEYRKIARSNTAIKNWVKK